MKSLLLGLREVEGLNCLHRIGLDHVEHFPLLELKILSTRPSEIPLAKIRSAGMLEIAWKI